MELKQLTYFIQISEDKSFSKAAKHLFLTQQALSKAIGNLEEELEVPLFNRTYTGLELTQYGIALHKKAITIVKQSSEIYRDIKKIKEEHDKKLTIVVSYGLIHELSVNLIQKFRKGYPDIQLTIRDHPDLICEDIILDNKAELGCVVGPVNRNLFESSLLFTEELYMLINKDNYLSYTHEITVKNLENEHFVLPTDDFKISQAFKTYCINKGFVPNITFVSNEISFLQRLVHFNEGITIIPQHEISQIVYSNIVPVKFPDNLHLEIFLVKQKNELYSAGTDIFWNFIINNL